MIAQWAKDELAGVDFGDARLDARVVKVLSDMGEKPNLSIPAACLGRAEMKAAYRFFDNDKVTFDKVLEPHVASTKQRMTEQKVVLLVQDTTEIDLTRPEQDVEGAGELDGSRRGFLLHLMHGFTPTGVPLGTLHAEIVNRTEGVSHETSAEKSSKRKNVPIEEKESFRRLSETRQAREVAQELPEVECVCVADSEADIYEVFAEPRGDKPVDWLIRACQDRSILSDSGLLLRGHVSATPTLYEVDLAIRGRSAKIDMDDRDRRKNRESRQTKVEVKAARVTLKPPYRPDVKMSPVDVNVVLVREPNAPTGEPPVEWLLVTTLPIDTLENIRTIVEYYCVRWSIEILFRTLKSGCRIERRRFEHIDRLLPCLGLLLIVAWRTMFVCYMGRNCPDLDCETMFEPSEWKAVWTAVTRKKPPKQAPRLSEMVHMIARLGGYIERPNSEPGTQTLWIGIQRMHDLAWAWETFGPETKIGAG